MNTRPYEIRWHGRGGQGAITAAKIVADRLMRTRREKGIRPHSRKSSLGSKCSVDSCRLAERGGRDIGSGTTT